ncbi:MAG: phosphopantothenoylcysteine decarboxylase [Eubacteriales bacterium]|nr:phosphopantothenoylcysteine decarboxylase [Eubacteriales bacterium]MDD3199584.1 phosphopantothenoylcysteine decarboxylase [Eubacteriales bacterium]MDD4629296.1 phosphopantothenoylcysteine decarboxylase [Eubacteriales bacterium]
MRNIIITAGGTSEKIDEVRVISNFSSGRLGLAVAKCFLESETADVGKIYYLCDRNTIVPSDERVEIVRVLGVQGLLDALTNLLTTKKIDAMIHAMAVSDYAVKKVTTIEAIKNGVDMSDKITADGKISSEIDDLVIVLKRTPKVIGEIKKLQKDTILVGFKLLSNVSKDELIETGYKLLKKNDCDMVLANDLSEISGDNHVGYLISQNGEYEKFTTKIQIAEEIVRNTERLLHKKEENK